MGHVYIYDHLLFPEYIAIYKHLKLEQVSQLVTGSN